MNKKLQNKHNHKKTIPGNVHKDKFCTILRQYCQFGEKIQKTIEKSGLPQWHIRALTVP